MVKQMDPRGIWSVTSDMPMDEVLTGLAILGAEVEGVEAWAFHRESVAA